MLLTEGLADAEEPEERIAGNVSCALKKARWPHLQARARQTTIGKDIDGAMLAIRAVNAWLKGVLAKEHARPALNQAVPGEAPFIPARKVGRMFDRNRRAFSGEDIARIAGTRHARQGAPGVTPCADEPGFDRSVTLAGPCGQGRVLTPRRHAGGVPQDGGGEPFRERMRRLAARLREQRAEGAQLDKAIAASLEAPGFGSGSA